MPYYAYSVSCGDIVLAPFDEDEGFPTFQKVLEKSGNRTIRIILDPPVDSENRSETLLNRLVKIGCEYEGANRSYIVINIPPNVDFEQIVSFMIENELRFEHADPSYSEIYGDES